MSEKPSNENPSAEVPKTEAKPKAEPVHAKAKNPHGNAGYHPSTKAFEHSGSRHTSKDR